MNYVFRNQIRRLFLYIIPSAEKRTKIIRKKGFFAEFGEDVFFQPRKLPADPKYIKFHNNIQIAANVTFITHDIIHRVFSKMDSKHTYYSHLGCIEVMDNVFIGAGTTVLPDVRIGPNVIVAAGSVVTKDVPPGTVVGGVPARVIGDFYDVMNRRANKLENSVNDREQYAETAWKQFYEKRKINSD